MSDASWMVFALTMAFVAMVAHAARAEQPAEQPAPDDRVRALLESPLVVQVPGIDSASITVRADLAYTSDADGPKLDAYLPPTGAEARRPAVVFVHGGPLPPGPLPGALASPKQWRIFRDWGKTAAARGWVGVVPDHRYRSLDGLADSTADLDAVLAYLKTHAADLGVDPERVVFWLVLRRGTAARTVPRGALAGAALRGRLLPSRR
ncbi:MAG: hypothetical protein HC897_07690, partial [Thermoanaerobaculia bacterium]|nr:hypothetical protein [Thermoanaerobaculia bacterium]